MKKKGQLTLEGAPAVVMIVGLVFLVMATMALVSEKYNDAFPSNEAGVGTDEQVSRSDIASASGATLNGANQENAESFSLGTVRNATVLIANGNFSLNANTGILTNVSSLALFGTTYFVNYTYNYAGIAANVTTDLNTEIANNTSIAGIILTISLVGIVLTILVGVFVAVRRNRV